MRVPLLFTRDLRVHDHPALAHAARPGNEVLPMFVLDERIARRSPNRTRFLRDCLIDLDRALAARGGGLSVRCGRPEEVVPGEAAKARCEAVYLTQDYTGWATRRATALRERCARLGIAVRSFPGHAVIEPGAIAPAGKTAYSVFTPYLRAWSVATRRRIERPPSAFIPVGGPGTGVPPGYRWPSAEAAFPPVGGESEARRRLRRFLRTGLASYGARRDRLDDDATSHLSAFLRFGCLSANEVVRLADHRGNGDFVRQVAWRDFFLQLVAADQHLTHRDLRPERAPRWVRDAERLDAWKRGETGEPLVDAAMRQLIAEGWMPNRARLIAASYLTRTLGIDWRAGAEHFDRHLVDGDPSSNAGNWQWVAGTGAAPRRGRALDLERQARRFDPEGAYRSRYP